ncbi:unnamed protein product [Sympodiomycopsis kandeliae]
MSASNSHALPNSIGVQQRADLGHPTTSRSGSIASLWSSADIPLFLDARRSSDAARKDSLASSRLVHGPQRAFGSVPSSTDAASRRGSDGLLNVAELDEENGTEWIRRDVPAGPMSPRPSVDSSCFSFKGASIPTRPSADANSTTSPSQLASLPRGSDSSNSSPRGFQNRKPVALQIQPIAYSSPLRGQNLQPRPQPSPGAQSTIAPSLATSPAPSQDTDASMDLPTPMTFKSAHSKSKRSEKSKSNSLYSKADQFFSSSYSMRTPPQTAHEFQHTEQQFATATLASTSVAPHVNPSTEHHRLANLEDEFSATPTAGPSAAYPPFPNPASWAHCNERTSPSKQLASPLRAKFLKSHSEQNSPAHHMAQLPDSPLRKPSALDMQASPLQPAIQLTSGTQRNVDDAGSFQDLTASDKPSIAFNSDNYEQVAQGKLRARTFSTPKLHSGWLASEESHRPLRKASFCPEVAARHNSQSQHIKEIPSRRNDASARSTSSSGEPPASPRARLLLRRNSRLGTPLSNSSPGRNRKMSNASLTQSLFKPPKSPSRPRSKAGWSSYLAEGLTLYLDQGGKRECAVRMPYLSYDPFGRPESLVQMSAPGAAPTTPKKSKLRPSSSRETFDNDVGLLQFAFPHEAGSPSPMLFASWDTAPILRHLGIGDDTTADLLTRQATLSLHENGVHQVSGFERNGRVAWRFQYEVSDSTEMDDTLAAFKALKAISFACSATLLDPSKARKGRLLKLVKKGVSTNLASNLIEISSGGVDMRKRSISANVAIDLVSPPKHPVIQTLEPSPLAEERGETLTAATEAEDEDRRRPSTRTTLSGSSVVRVDRAAAPIPTNLPATVIPFKLRPSISNMTNPAIGASATNVPSAQSSRIITLAAEQATTAATDGYGQMHGKFDRQGPATKLHRPRTAAEEIKREYLERANAQTANIVADPFSNNPSTLHTRPASARDAGPQTSVLKKPLAKAAILDEPRSFAAIKAESRHHLRKAISTKALPGLPTRPITAQNLSAPNAQASASLLVELGFI